MSLSRRASGSLSAIVVAASVLAACSGSDSSVSSPPADFSGNFSVSITNGANGCNYANWQVGKETQNIPFQIAQSGASASGQVQGAANIVFALLGIGTLQGPVTGSSASLSAVGTTSLKQGACAYFVHVTADITLTGDTINGTLTYTDQTNKSPDCGALEHVPAERRWQSAPEVTGAGPATSFPARAAEARSLFGSS
jgi:hypothetical protein